MKLTSTASYISSDTPILTKKGWKLAKNIRPGNILYDTKGHWTKVLHAERASKKKLCYKVTFADNSFIEGTSKLELCHLNQINTKARIEHNYKLNKLKTEAKLRMFSERIPYNVALDWKAYDYIKKLEFKNYITLHDLKERFSYTDYNCLNHHCPSVLAEPYHDKPMTIHPYLLGIWLVNGNRQSTILNIKKQRIFEKLDKLGYQLTLKEYTQYRVLGVRSYLKKMKLFEQKHIPYAYKYGSYKTRLQIIEAFTDGIAKGGAFSKEIPLVDPVIVKDFREMLFTMNVPIKTYSFTPEPYKDRIYRERHVTRFSLRDLEEFYDERDLEKYKIRQNVKRWAKITSCNKSNTHNKFVGIVVSSNEHGFLVGTSLIPVKDNFFNINKRTI